MIVHFARYLSTFPQFQADEIFEEEIEHFSVRDSRTKTDRSAAVHPPFGAAT
jgi:hypothetical protein